MPGYDLTVNGDYARIESLKCPACELILRDAIQTEQGVRLCRSCYDDIQRDPKKLLSKLDFELEPNEPFHPDKAVRKEVEKIPVKCSNHRVGCEWRGSLVDHERKHKQECNYKSEECPLGCGVRLLVDQLDNHRRKECPLRDIQCPHCNTPMKAEEYNNHLINCPKAPFICEWCDSKMLKSERQKHRYLDCKKSAECFACTKQVHKTVPAIQAHLKDQADVFVHFQKTGMRVKNLENGLSEAGNRVEQVEKKIQDGGQSIEQLQTSVGETKSKLNSLENKMSAEMERVVRDLSRRVEDLEAKNNKQDQIISRLQTSGVGGGYQSNLSSEEYIPGDRLGQLDGKIAETDRQLAVLKVNISELELQLQASLASTYNGSFLWRIPDIKRRKRDALEGKITSIYSPPFYTGRNGYKMCIRAYLNGDGIGYNTHLSIFFVLMKGEYDPLLKWPFDYKVSLILVDQEHRRHIVQTFKPSPSSSSFQRPKSDMNIASGCPKFADLKVLDNDSYVKEDVMYIKCIVDTSRIYHP